MTQLTDIYARTIDDLSDGDTVCVTFTSAYGGKESTVEAEVVTDPFTQRKTPDNALDLHVKAASGAYYARVTPTATLYGLHYATRRHDHRKGNVTRVQLVGDEEDR